MKTPEPLSAEQLNELCHFAKVSAPDSVVKVSREELWSLVEMAKERNELLSEDKKT